MDNQTELRPERRKRYVPPRVLVQVYIREEEAVALRQLSERRDVPMTAIVREAVGRLVTEAGLLKGAGQ